jgi:hypothetical protein
MCEYIINVKREVKHVCHIIYFRNRESVAHFQNKGPMNRMTYRCKAPPNS